VTTGLVREFCGVTEPDAVTPDDRDWTFVITEGCGECGFRPPTPEDTGQRLRATVPIWQNVLASEAASRRPVPTVWSAVEYGCHVRDTCRLFRERLGLMLTEDDAEFPNWDQDATAVAEDYFHHDPAEVAVALVTEAEATAAAFDAVGPSQWGRRGRRSNGSTFTVGTLAVYFLHDIEHHVHDVEPA